jgi:hypothetical protein
MYLVGEFPARNILLGTGRHCGARRGEACEQAKGQQKEKKNAPYYMYSLGPKRILPHFFFYHVLI